LGRRRLTILPFASEKQTARGNGSSALLTVLFSMMNGI
jgi:hypothetical protein